MFNMFIFANSSDGGFMIKCMGEIVDPEEDILTVHDISEYELRKAILKRKKDNTFIIGENEYHYYAVNANILGWKS